LRAEGLSCSLDVLYGGLGISKLQFLIQQFVSTVFFLSKFLVIKTLDPDSLEMLAPDPVSGILIKIVKALLPLIYKFSGQSCCSEESSGQAGQDLRGKAHARTI
jgi:hypothetical protein